MDPKVKEILNRVRESAIGAGKAAGKFAGDVVGQAKLSLQIFDLNTEIDVSFKEIGKLVYAVHKGEDICSEAIQSQIEGIDSKAVQVAELRAKLAGLKNTKTCPGCGRTVSRNDAFCPVCGTKQDDEDAAAEAENTASCCCDCEEDDDDCGCGCGCGCESDKEQTDKPAE